MKTLSVLTVSLLCISFQLSAQNFIGKNIDYVKSQIESEGKPIKEKMIGSAYCITVDMAENLKTIYYFPKNICTKYDMLTDEVGRDKLIKGFYTMKILRSGDTWENEFFVITLTRQSYSEHYIYIFTTTKK